MDNKDIPLSFPGMPNMVVVDIPDPTAPGGKRTVLEPAIPMTSSVEHLYQEQLKSWSWTEILNGLRSNGWMVAVHNDYRLNGQLMTFWLFTHPNGRWIKGEGVSDADALTICWKNHWSMVHNVG